MINDAIKIKIITSKAILKISNQTRKFFVIIATFILERHLQTRKYRNCNFLVVLLNP